MKGRFSGLVMTLMALAFAMLTLTAFAQEKMPATPAKPAAPVAPAKLHMPSIEGTYKLVSHALPGGKTMAPPEIQGLQTFTKNYRNFNVAWPDSSGKHFSYSIISMYKLTNDEYSETRMYSMMNDEIGIVPGKNPGSGPVYMMVPETKSSPVKVEGNKVAFHPPFDPPNVVFEGNRMTATLEGGFVDTWEKVR